MSQSKWQQSTTLVEEAVVLHHVELDCPVLLLGLREHLKNMLIGSSRGLSSPLR